MMDRFWQAGFVSFPRGWIVISRVVSSPNRSHAERHAGRVGSMPVGLVANRS